MTQSTFRAPTKLVLAIATVVLASVGLDAARAKVGADRHRPDNSTAVLVALTAVMDSVTADRDAAMRLLEWFEESQSASSGALINDLRRFNTMHTMPASLATILRDHTAMDVSIDAATVEGLLFAIESAEREAAYAYRLLQRDLDAGLEPGIWYHINDRDPGPHRIDFRGALFQLDSAGFETSVRTMLRALDGQLQALTRIRARVTAAADTAGARS